MGFRIEKIVCIDFVADGGFWALHTVFSLHPHTAFAQTVAGMLRLTKG